MDIIGISQTVKDATYTDVDDAISKLDDSLESEFNSLVSYCKNGETDCAYDCMVNIEKIKSLKGMLVDVRKQLKLQRFSFQED